MRELNFKKKQLNACHLLIHSQNQQYHNMKTRRVCQHVRFFHDKGFGEYVEAENGCILVYDYAKVQMIPHGN